MNILHITEYAKVSAAGMGVNPPLSVRTLSIQPGDNQHELERSTQFIRCISDVTCRVFFDNSGNGVLLPGGEVEYFAVSPGVQRVITVEENA